MPAYSWTLSGAPPAPVGGGASTAVSTALASGGIDTDYGKDLTTWQSSDQEEPDLDPTFTFVSNKQAVSQACARRLCMRHGAFVEEPDAGFDLRRFMNGKWTRARAFSVKTGVERECTKDERVYAATAKITYIPRTRSLVVETDLDTMFGEFRLVLGVDDVSVRILRATE